MNRNTALVLRALGALVALALSTLVVACEAPDAGAGLLCTPGENIFCRCRGGDAGTKQCRSDGQGFEQCNDGFDACEEAAGATEGDWDEEEDAGYKALLEPCEQSNECESGMCRMGYCTKPCGNWLECTDEDAGVYADCVQIDGAAQHCVPYCGSQQDCDPFGAPSACGYTLATDVVAVQVCADWAGLAPLPPEGTPCDDDWACHLGHAERQRVCEFDVCIGGCHVDDDCPQGQSCTSGSPGHCQ
jgi:hypothetical protein